MTDLDSIRVPEVVSGPVCWLPPRGERHTAESTFTDSRGVAQHSRTNRLPRTDETRPSAWQHKGGFLQLEPGRGHPVATDYLSPPLGATSFPRHGSVAGAAAYER